MMFGWFVDNGSPTNMHVSFLIINHSLTVNYEFCSTTINHCAKWLTPIKHQLTNIPT